MSSCVKLFWRARGQLPVLVPCLPVASLFGFPLTTSCHTTRASYTPIPILPAPDNKYPVVLDHYRVVDNLRWVRSGGGPENAVQRVVHGLMDAHARHVVVNNALHGKDQRSAGWHCCDMLPGVSWAGALERRVFDRA